MPKWSEIVFHVICFSTCLHLVSSYISIVPGENKSLYVPVGVSLEFLCISREYLYHPSNNATFAVNSIRVPYGFSTVNRTTIGITASNGWKRLIVFGMGARDPSLASVNVQCIIGLIVDRTQELFGSVRVFPRNEAYVGESYLFHCPLWLGGSYNDAYSSIWTIDGFYSANVREKTDEYGIPKSFARVTMDSSLDGILYRTLRCFAISEDGRVIGRLGHVVHHFNTRRAPSVSKFILNRCENETLRLKWTLPVRVETLVLKSIEIVGDGGRREKKIFSATLGPKVEHFDIGPMTRFTADCFTVLFRGQADCKVWIVANYDRADSSPEYALVNKS